nr:TonB-dependent receptor [Saprospiraceae bacterium]
MILVSATSSWGQTSTQTVKGVVIDRSNQQTLTGANITLVDSEPVRGTTTDINGRFELRDIPLGRHSLRVSYLGYETAIVAHFLVTSAREVHLEIELRRAAQETEEVLVRPVRTDSEPLNEFATLSSRSFSVEETQRYAASVNDPGRLAVGFPGVQPQRDTRTDIFVRGNSASGVSWRLMGVDIPNPNHFARIGSSGGGISIFSASLLSTSDFSSGAFPAEYGNALSGVFDMKFRKGNMYNRNYTFRAGILGLDLAAEGPIKKGNSSYLVNYRYSTLGILNELGIHLVGPRISNTFQDLSFAVNWSGKNNEHHFTLWGIGGISRENEHVKEDKSEWKTYTDYLAYDFNTDMGAIGMSHTYLIDDQSYLTTSVALMGQQIILRYDTLNTADQRYTIDDQDHRDNRLTLASNYNRRIGTDLQLKAGIHFSLINYNFFRQRFDFEEKSQELLVYGSGNTFLYQAFLQAAYQPHPRWNFSAGLRTVFFTLNNTSSVEPRLGLSYQLDDRQRLSLAYGFHGMVLPMGSYFTRNPDHPGELPNLDLDMVKSHHLILGYSLDFSRGWRAGVELYYQHLQDVPVVDDINRTYWYLNEIQSFATEPLVSRGLGYNRGVDVTLERFFDRGIFMILSGSVFNSEYEPLNGERYSTQFNSRYAATMMGGYEWPLGEGNSLQVGAKIIYTAGLPIHPLLSGADEINDREPPVDESKPFSIQVADYFRTDLRIAWRKNYPATSFLLALDIQNATSRENVDIVRRQYDPDLNEWVYNRLAGITPLISFQLDF